MRRPISCRSQVSAAAPGLGPGPHEYTGGKHQRGGHVIQRTIEQLQNDLDEWIDHYNNERSHQGEICEG